MNNILIYSDLHISQSSEKECISILEEIGMLANKYKVDTLINLGDTFDSIKPTSSELDIFATFIRRLGNKQHIIIAANSHESTTQEESILNHYGILSDNIQIVKVFKDANHLYCGHFSVKESSKNYDAKLSKTDLKNYLYVFLGHIHSYELIKPNIVHLGSCRYINFDEVKDKQKIVALIMNYGSESEKVHFPKLKSPISMIQLELQTNTIKNSILDLQNEAPNPKELISEGESASNSSQNPTIIEIIAKLDKIDPKTKVKIIIKDFESFKEFLPFIHKCENKFVVFKVENDFSLISDNTSKRVKSEIEIKEAIKQYLEENKIDEEVQKIIKEEIK